MRNAIPSSAEVVLTLPKENVEAFKEVVAEWRQTFKDEYEPVEQTLELDVEDVALPAYIVRPKFRTTWSMRFAPYTMAFTA